MDDAEFPATARLNVRNTEASRHMQDDMLSQTASHALAAAMSHPTPTPPDPHCAWCEQPFPFGRGYGVFCTKACGLAEVTHGDTPGMKARAVDFARAMTLAAARARAERVARDESDIQWGREAITGQSFTDGDKMRVYLYQQWAISQGWAGQPNPMSHVMRLRRIADVLTDELIVPKAVAV